MSRGVKVDTNVKVSGSIPCLWAEGKVSDVIKALESGVSVNGEDRKRLSSEKGVLKVSAVSYGYFDEFAQKVISVEGELARAKTHPKIGQVIISRSNTEELVGASAYIDKNYDYLFLPDKLWQTIPYPKSNMKWLSYVLASDKSRYTLSKLATGTSGSMKNITKGELLGLKVLIPPPPEQKKIAKILSTWDRAIEITEKLLNNSQQQKKSLMQQLLPGKKRLPGFGGEWQSAPVKKMGKIVSGGTPATKVAKYWEGDVLWMTPTDVTALKNRFINNTKRKITQSGVKNSSATLIPKGSLLVCTRATIGLMSISTTEITTNQGFKNIVPDENHDVNFLYYLFNFFKNKLIAHACGSTFLELSKKDFERLSFVCPSMEEQQAISSILSTADKEVETLQQKLAHLKQEKKALMQQLLTGKRRVVL